MRLLNIIIQFLFIRIRYNTTKKLGHTGYEPDNRWELLYFVVPLSGWWGHGFSWVGRDTHFIRLTNRRK